MLNAHIFKLILLIFYSPLVFAENFCSNTLSMIIQLETKDECSRIEGMNEELIRRSRGPKGMRYMFLELVDRRADAVTYCNLSWAVKKDRRGTEILKWLEEAKRRDLLKCRDFGGKHSYVYYLYAAIENGNIEGIKILYRAYFAYMKAGDDKTCREVVPADQQDKQPYFYVKSAVPVSREFYGFINLAYHASVCAAGYGSFDALYSTAIKLLPKDSSLMDYVFKTTSEIDIPKAEMYKRGSFHLPTDKQQVSLLDAVLEIYGKVKDEASGMAGQSKSKYRDRTILFYKKWITEMFSVMKELHKIGAATSDPKKVTDALDDHQKFMSRLNSALLQPAQATKFN
jgi:hypothetical protein